jgi:hypothetical protein
MRLYCTMLLIGLTAANAHAASLTADQYINVRKTLGASAPQIAALKGNPSGFVGKIVEIAGTVTGIAKCGDTASVILNCSGESLLVKSSGELPACVATGSKIRALVEIGEGSIASLSDLELVESISDYEISVRERQLAPKPAPAKKSEVAPSPSRPVAQSQLASRGGFDPQARIREIFVPYKKAIARFNPKLKDDQLNAITNSILAFSWNYQVDPRLVVAIILTESGFKPNATSRVGAMGLGQLMPGTARGMGVADAYDPVQNIEASTRLIRGHLERYGDIQLALSAYNAGPGAVRKYGGVPPYRETVNYVQKVTALYKALCGR